jgi:two-component system chemotaxis response regulator CheB
MPVQDIIVIGGSAGGLEALMTVLQGVPGTLRAAVFIVLHTSPESEGVLPQILARHCNLPVAYPENGEPIEAGCVYVAPPDYHLLLAPGAIGVIRGPRENGFRPAIDPLFRSAAKEYDGRTVGVILSGALDDGTFGLMAIKDAGGTAIVQHPYEAFMPSMPLSAIQNVEVDHIVRAAEISPLLTRAAAEGLQPSGREPRPAASRPTPSPNRERSLLETADLAGKQPDKIAEPPTFFSCPECGGTLWEVHDHGQSRFRCHTGHGFTPDTLLAGQNGKLETALWSAVRVLQERAALHRQLADRTSQRGLASTSEKYTERAQQEEANAALLRDILATPRVPSGVAPTAGVVPHDKVAMLAD